MLRTGGGAKPPPVRARERIAWNLTENVLEIRDLVKDFPSVRAVNNVSFDIKRNTVHCLVGENGAGKSTLIKILTGALVTVGRQDPPER